MDVSVAKKKRGVSRARITILCKEIEDLIKTPEEANKIRVKMESLEQHYTVVSECDGIILKDLEEGDADLEAIVKESGEIDGYLEKFKLTMESAIAVLPQPPPKEEHSRPSSPVPSECGSAFNYGRNYKIPELKLRKFSGQILDWLPYWSQYRSIHDDDTIPKSVKFALFLESLSEAPEALQLVSDYSATDDNYDEVVRVISNRYGREDIQIQEHVRRLLLLKDPSNQDSSFQKQWITSEAYIRNLKSLKVEGVDSETWLYLILEGTVPKDILLQWQLSPDSRKDGRNEDPPKSRLDYFRNFVNQQLEARLNVELATKLTLSQPETKKPNKVQQQKKSQKKEEKVATAAGLFIGQSSSGCIFCEGKHDSAVCGKAMEMTLENRKKKLMEKKACLKCFKVGHRAKVCKTFLKCLICSSPHQALMCPSRAENTSESVKNVPPPALSPNASSFVPTQTIADQSSVQCSGDVLMKTLLVKASCSNSKESRIVRLLFDEGCQRSSVTKHLVQQLRSRPVGKENIREVLANGSVTPYKTVYRHEITLSDLNNEFSMQVVLREKNKIGGGIPRVPVGPWISRLQEQNIALLDCVNVPVSRTEIDICIGSDCEALIKTGAKVDVGYGLAAWHTHLGWTLSGPIKEETVGTTINSGFCGEQEVSRLWNLEVLGISDPISKLSEAEEEQEALQTFNQTTTRLEDGRYSVKLPWKSSSSDLPTNRKIAENRLQSTTRKLKSRDKYEDYDRLFNSWLQEGFIEEVDQDDGSGHYLPHHPVFKESATTPVRPVFDASCKSTRSPSLNDCLYKGPNCIELLPSILMRFRRDKVGVVADIRKAFQMIEVQEEDRKFLKFLWWREENTKIKTFRHCRVVFGVNSSPFLLAAVLKLHLTSCKYDQNLASKILSSMYVDNLVTSVTDHEEAEDLKDKATLLLKEAQMDLRQWEKTLGDGSGVGQSSSEWCGLEPGKVSTKVLGLTWDKEEDTLSLIVPPMEDFSKKITKRSLLSLVSQIFDPLGFACPALIVPKLIIQTAWKEKQDWDSELDETSVQKVKDWMKSIWCLSEVKIPRMHGLCNAKAFELHTFTDASKDAYACAIFLKTENNPEVTVQLLAAKARVAPFVKDKRPTIPRLELMGCLIGARMAHAVKEALGLHEIASYYWSDSSTALAWIKRNDDWGTFVGNRVRAIISLSEPHQWRHVPGHMNPADLPSRGCTPEEVLQTTWWEGPNWLRNREEWPSSDPYPDEESIEEERKKTQAKMFSYNLKFPINNVYAKNVRTIAWWQRFINFKFRKQVPASKVIRIDELRQAEMGIIRSIQGDMDITTLKKKFDLLHGEDGIIRVRTAITNRKDEFDFLFPILLPGSHELVRSLIRECHLNYCHAGTQFLMSKLREKFWITQSRKSISYVLHHCVTCQRYGKKNATQVPAPLPEKRLADGEVFATTGVDLAGPLFLKNGKKVWIVLFTCAVYRCLVLDLVTSLETISFLQALERFISTYGRPVNLYSDNGTNFVGASNLFKDLNWEEIQKHSQTRQIQWTFNPPTAAWWGGFWERMVRSTKELLRRMLGKTKLNFEELRTVIASVSATINDRPLTTVSEDPSDLKPLTPAMFLRGTKGTRFPEGSEITGSMLKGHYQKMQEIRDQINARFRKEYLALLVRKPFQPSSDLKIGQLVLVGSDNKKRFEWPLGRILELITGVDGKIRVVRVKTMGGELTRPIQRIYPLELPEVSSPPPVETMGATDEDEITPEEMSENSVRLTRFGRKINKPVRYGSWKF